MLVRFWTFSPIIHLGLTSLMTLNISSQRYRSSSLPFCLPAIEKLWHGNPPTMTSALIFVPSNFLISSYIGISFQCFCKTFWQNLSCSQKATVLNLPVDSRPTLKPPIPLNKSSTLNSMLHLSKTLLVLIYLCSTNELLVGQQCQSQLKICQYLKHGCY